MWNIEFIINYVAHNRRYENLNLPKNDQLFRKRLFKKSFILRILSLLSYYVVKYPVNKVFEIPQMIYGNFGKTQLKFRAHKSHKNVSYELSKPWSEGKFEKLNQNRSSSLYWNFHMISSRNFWDNEINWIYVSTKIPVVEKHICETSRFISLILLYKSAGRRYS